MQAINKYVTLRKIDESLVSESGLELTAGERDRTRYRYAEVLSVGEEVAAVKEGDKVCYDRTNAFTLFVEGTHVTVVRGGDIVGVL